jgi:hypothetical protein
MRRIALLATVALGVTACQTVKPPAGLVEGTASAGAEFSYSGGRGVQVFPQPLATVQSALVAALGDVKVDKLRQTRDGGVIVMEGETDDHRKASVSLRPHAGGSRLTARFGWFGDEPLSRALMNRVAVRLGNLPPSAIPTDPPSAPSANPFFSRSAVPDSVMLKNQYEAPYRSSPIP